MVWIAAWNCLHSNCWESIVFFFHIIRQIEYRNKVKKVNNIFTVSSMISMEWMESPMADFCVLLSERRGRQWGKKERKGWTYITSGVKKKKDKSTYVKIHTGWPETKLWGTFPCLLLPDDTHVWCHQISSHCIPACEVTITGIRLFQNNSANVGRYLADNDHHHHHNRMAGLGWCCTCCDRLTNTPCYLAPTWCQTTVEAGVSGLDLNSSCLVWDVEVVVKYYCDLNKIGGG